MEVVRVSELLRRGMTRRQVDRLVRPDTTTGLRLLGQRSTVRARNAQEWLEADAEERSIRVAVGIEIAPDDGVLAGWAAAAQHGVPATFVSGRDGRGPLPVDVCVPRGEGRKARSGIRLRQSRVPPSQIVDVGGVAITSPERTAVDLARWTRKPARRLAMLDASLRFGLVTAESLEAFLEPLGGLHGLDRVRSLVPLSSPYAESVPESEVRYLCAELQLPRIVPNVDITDRWGAFVGRVDGIDPDTGFGFEYQGYWHRIDGAAEADVGRLDRFASMNMSIVPLTNEDMRDGVAPGKLHHAYDRALRRDPRLDAWCTRRRG